MKLYRLEEKDTPTKLEILFKKNLYSLAINLAHSQKYDDASISEIFKKYGDHLYRYFDGMTRVIRFDCLNKSEIGFWLHLARQITMVRWHNIFEQLDNLNHLTSFGR